MLGQVTSSEAALAFVPSSQGRHDHGLPADPRRDGRTASEVPINEQLPADQGAPMEASQAKGQIAHQEKCIQLTDSE